METFEQKYIYLLKDKIAELTCDCKSDLKNLGHAYHQVECVSAKVLAELDKMAHDGLIPLGKG